MDVPFLMKIAHYLLIAGLVIATIWILWPLLAKLRQGMKGGGEPGS